MQITSQKQRKFFGAVARGNVKKAGLRPAKAMMMLNENRGMMRNLPERAPARTAKRSASRVSRRGGR